jgi:hypothetical protein
MNGTMLLAEADLIQLIAVVVIAVIGGLSHLLNKRAQEQEKQRREREAKEHAQRLASLGKSPSAATASSAQRTRPAAPVRPATGTAKPRQPQPMVRRPVRPTTVRPGPAPIAVLPRPERSEAVRVGDELRREQERLRLEELDRERRMAELPRGVADRHIGTAGRSATADVFAEVGEASEDAAAVDLYDPAAARQAMIMHEIFSAPLALRSEQASWNA